MMGRINVLQFDSFVFTHGFVPVKKQIAMPLKRQLQASTPTINILPKLSQNFRSFFRRLATLAMIWIGTVAAPTGCSVKPPETPRAKVRGQVQQTSAKPMSDQDWQNLSEEQWEKRLSPEEYRILRRQGTERPFQNEYWDAKTPGTYRCRGCGLPLFTSATKFDSGTGWPSFYQPLQEENVATQVDRSWFQSRTEVHCSRCGGHLGHVFDDGKVWDVPTGKRYCLNSLALRLDEDLPPEDPSANAGNE